MSKVVVTGLVSLPADEVWRLIGPFGGIGEWAPGILSCETEGTGVGAVRTMKTIQGGIIRERLETENPAALSYSYSILEGPFPVADYLATLKVIPQSPRQSQIEWSSDFKVTRDFPEEKARKIFQSMYAAAIAAAKDQLG